jgi:hypothetical protein
MRSLSIVAAFALPALVCGADAVTAQDITETVTDDRAASEQPVAPPPDTGLDVTESVGDVTESVEPASSVPPPPPPPLKAASAESSPAPRITLNGWVRQSFDWTFNDEGYRSAQPDSLSLARDKLVSRSQLLLRAGYQQGDFEAAVSGLVDANLHEQGTADARPFNGFNGQRTDGHVEGTLREAYLGLGSGPLDVRIGQQRVAWGRSDVYAPNDVINARDLRDPFLGDPELRYVPTPLLRVSLSLDRVSLEGVVSPVFVPDRFELLGSNWGPLGLDAPPSIRGFFNQLRNAVDPSIQADLTRILHQTKLPEPFMDATSAGLKLAATLLDVDISAYYQNGYDGTPNVQTNDSFAYLLKQTDFTQSKFANLQPVLRALDAGLVPFRSEYVRRHHLGFDAATTLGQFVLRIDAAYESARVFYAADFSSFISRAVLGVAGIEFQTGALDQIIEIELVYVGVLDQPNVAVLGYARNTYAAALVARWPMFDVFSLNLRAIAGIVPRTYVLQPALRITLDALALDVGALVMGGDVNSLGWISRRNSCAFVQARYAF